MKPANCSQEEAVAMAAGTENWPGALAAHTEHCAVCRDVAQTARAMRDLASPLNEVDESDPHGISQQTRPLPDPDLIWQRARLDEAHTGKINAVIEWAQIGSAAAAPVGLAGWVAWNWYTIEAMTEQFLLETWPQLSTATYVLASLAPAVLTVATLALVYPLLSGE
jgi:hypothetical protein